MFVFASLFFHVAQKIRGDHFPILFPTTISLLNELMKWTYVMREH